MGKRACLLFLIVLAAAARPAPLSAVIDVTVNKLDQTLAGIRRENDAKAARQIAGLRLTERASAVWLAKWEADFRGNRARAALMAVVDASAFLKPPAAEIPATPPPDAAGQQQMVAHAREYTKETLHRMPNFFALRTTTSFVVATEGNVDSAQEMNNLFQKQREPKPAFKDLGPGAPDNRSEPQLFWMGTLAQQVTYRGGFEVADSSSVPGQEARSPLRLTTVGEFGSVLELLLRDIDPDKMTWDHWEQGAVGPLAVFRYSVPAERSDFGVDFANGQHENPAYHGEVVVDAADGSIWRITILASGSETGLVEEWSILVEFAPTEIGKVSYVCPVRGVAIVRSFDTFEYANTLHVPVPLQTSINDVSFTRYHLLRSESRIFSGASKP